MTLKEINYYHNAGKMPDWAWAQQNGKSAQDNYAYQRNKFIEYLEKCKKVEEIKKQIEEQIFLATQSSLEESAAAFEKEAAANIVNNITAAFDGGIHPERLKSVSFSTQLAAGLGRALVNGVFKTLDDLFDDETKRR